MERNRPPCGPAAYEALIARVQADALGVRDLLHNTAAGLEAAQEPEDGSAEGDDEAAPVPPPTSRVLRVIGLRQRGASATDAMANRIARNVRMP